jgi:hypothetical protein
MSYEPGYGLTEEQLRQLLTLGVMLDLGHG